MIRIRILREPQLSKKKKGKKMSKVSIIVAVSDNGAIGIEQRLPWRLSADLKHFKALTVGHTVIMGRNTFESLPNGPLPNRKNIVLSSRKGLEVPGCTLCSSLPEALAECAEEAEVFIIGGATVYRQALSKADKLYLTRVHHTFESADTFFPEVDWSEWEEEGKEDFLPDEKNEYPYTFYTYRRKE